MAGVTCKDCEPGSKRPAPHPGPRCATHHRERKKVQRDLAHSRHIEKTYGISALDYWDLHVFQGERCAICQRASGAVRRLAVDHDHRCTSNHPPELGCQRCVRGLLCKPCNRMLGHLRDDPEMAERAASYLRYPPAMDVIRIARARSALATADSTSASPGSSADGAPDTGSSGSRT